MAKKNGLWWVGGGLRITGLTKLKIPTNRKQNKNLAISPYSLDVHNSLYIQPQFTNEDLIKKRIDTYSFKYWIEQLLQDKPDGHYYIHARPPASWGRLHGLYCIPIAHLEKQGTDFNWDYRYTYKTKLHPYKKKKKVMKIPRHRRKTYLLHDHRIFPK